MVNIWRDSQFLSENHSKIEQKAFADQIDIATKETQVAENIILILKSIYENSNLLSYSG